MNKIAIGIIIGLLIIVGGAFILSRNASESALPVDTNLEATTTPIVAEPVSTSTPAAAPKAGEYTMSDVSKHNNSSSCWTAINGGVYDLTAWIGSHPGGPDKIISICGKDGTAAFTGQHDGAKKQADVLATFKIGILIN